MWQPLGATILLVTVVELSLPSQASSRPRPTSNAIANDFGKLWEAVVVGGAYRGPPQGEPQRVKRVCLFGLNNDTYDAALVILADPAIEVLEIDDVDISRGAPRETPVLANRLQEEFGDRVYIDFDYTWPPGRPDLAVPGSPLCDVVVYSDAAPRFALERVQDRLGAHVVVAFVSYDCIANEEMIPTPLCNHLNVQYEKTPLFKTGYCAGSVCMARTPTENLRDPNVLPLNCSSLDEANAIGEFGQDWFLYANFFQTQEADQKEKRTYVDVGASLPFEWSNSVLFDRCLGWKGLCIEPNPHLLPLLHGYRSCKTVARCVNSQRINGNQFSDRSGEPAFRATCDTMNSILQRAALASQRIHVLSIDVEHGELKVLQGLAFSQIDVRFIVVEVTHGVQWLEVDSLLLPQGYAKVAILGRDAVYAKLDELMSGGFADWPFLSSDVSGRPVAELPSNWAEFHERVVDEEAVAEQRAEREMVKKGMRRT